VLSLGYGEEPIYGAASITKKGGKVGALYGWVTDGLFQSEDEICRDVTGVTCRERGWLIRHLGQRLATFASKTLTEMG
jgi:hypothetical protein